MGERIREMTNRLSRGVDPEVRHVLGHVGDALQDLEQTITRLQHQITLQEMGLNMRPELVSIGESGLDLQRVLPRPVGEEVRVFVDITVRGSSRLLGLTGRIVASRPEGRVVFEGLTQDLRDTLVAFVFQEQGREIRHAHASRTAD